MEMCNEIMRTMPDAFHHIPDRHKTQEMCIKAAEVDSSFLELALDYLKTQEMCDKAFEEDPSSLIYVPDWFVTQQQVRSWDDELTKWYQGYQKRKVQKAQIKNELMSISWHPSR